MASPSLPVRPDVSAADIGYAEEFALPPKSGSRKSTEKKSHELAQKKEPLFTFGEHVSNKIPDITFSDVVMNKPEEAKPEITPSFVEQILKKAEVMKDACSAKNCNAYLKNKLCSLQKSLTFPDPEKSEEQAKQRKPRAITKRNAAATENKSQESIATSSQGNASKNSRSSWNKLLASRLLSNLIQDAFLINVVNKAYQGRKKKEAADGKTSEMQEGDFSNEEDYSVSLSEALEVKTAKKYKKSAHKAIEDSGSSKNFTSESLSTKKSKKSSMRTNEELLAKKTKKSSSKRVENANKSDDEIVDNGESSVTRRRNKTPIKTCENSDLRNATDDERKRRSFADDTFTKHPVSSIPSYQFVEVLDKHRETKEGAENVEVEVKNKHVKKTTGKRSKKAVKEDGDENADSKEEPCATKSKKLRAKRADTPKDTETFERTSRGSPVIEPAKKTSPSKDAIKPDHVSAIVRQFDGIGRGNRTSAGIGANYVGDLDLGCSDSERLVAPTEKERSKSERLRIWRESLDAYWRLRSDRSRAIFEEKEKYWRAKTDYLQQRLTLMKSFDDTLKRVQAAIPSHPMAAQLQCASLVHRAAKEFVRSELKELDNFERPANATCGPAPPRPTPPVAQSASVAEGRAADVSRRVESEERGSELKDAPGEAEERVPVATDGVVSEEASDEGVGSDVEDKGNADDGQSCVRQAAAMRSAADVRQELEEQMFGRNPLEVSKKANNFSAHDFRDKNLSLQFKKREIGKIRKIRQEHAIKQPANH